MTVATTATKALRCGRCNNWLCDYAEIPGQLVVTRCHKCKMEYVAAILPSTANAGYLDIRLTATKYVPRHH